MLAHFKSELDDIILKVDGLLEDSDFSTCVGDFALFCLNSARFQLQSALFRVDAQLMNYEDSV